MLDGTFDDMPEDIRAAAADVFSVQNSLPEVWGNPVRPTFLSCFMTSGPHCFLQKRLSKQFKAMLTPSFLAFLRTAWEMRRDMFSPKVDHKDCLELLSELQLVHSAWVRLCKMREAKHPWSESDYASQV